MYALDLVGERRRRETISAFKSREAYVVSEPPCQRKGQIRHTDKGKSTRLPGVSDYHILILDRQFIINPRYASMTPGKDFLA
jgi:hypothetical protein